MKTAFFRRIVQVWWGVDDNVVLNRVMLPVKIVTELLGLAFLGLARLCAIIIDTLCYAVIVSLAGAIAIAVEHWLSWWALAKSLALYELHVLQHGRSPDYDSWKSEGFRDAATTDKRPVAVTPDDETVIISPTTKDNTNAL